MQNVLRFSRSFWVILMAAVVLAVPPPSAGQEKATSPTSSAQKYKDWCEPLGTSRDWRIGLLRMANGFTKDGFAVSQNTYRGCHGDNVFFETFHYRSPERAKEEFDARLKSAPKILEQRKKLDEDGQVKAELAVISVLVEGKNPSAMIISVSDDRFRDVRSDSMEDILSIAKTLTP